MYCEFKDRFWYLVKFCLKSNNYIDILIKKIDYVLKLLSYGKVGLSFNFIVLVKEVNLKSYLI